MAKQKPQQISKRMQKRAEQRRKKRMTQIAIIALVVLMISGTIWAYFSSKAAQKAEEAFPAEVTVEQAHELYEEGAFVLDVRTQEEWDEYHAPGTTLIPQDELASRLDEVPRDRDVVVVCRSGNRSQEARDILLDAGFERVTSMDGGLIDWLEAGYPIE